MKRIQFLIVLMFATMSIQSCRKDGDIFEVTPPTIINPTEFGTNVQSSVIGTVVDENGEAIADATVTLNNLAASTDEFGVFQFKDQTMHSGGTYVKVEKDGFFHGSRKFYPTTESTSKVNIELMTMNEVAYFSSTSAEKVEFEGVEIEFDNNGIMNEDGSDYEGNVKVFAKYLDPTMLETLNQMPGDLTAIDENDQRVSLTSYGMVTVELRDDAGNKLQVKTGSTAEITMPVPTEIIASAPETIPLWHFDENQGTWIEEGEATLIDGQYIGEVSHFSYWNCDVPSDFIHLSGTIYNRNIPVAGVLVKITLENDNASGSGYTNFDGVFGGFVPKGETLVIEIFDQCGNLLQTEVAGPYEEDTVLDPINLLITSQQVTLTGTVSSCDVELSDATYVLITQNGFTDIVFINDDNTFEANIFYCQDGDEVTVGAQDPLNQVASPNSTFSIEGDVDVGTLELCEQALFDRIYFKYGDQQYIAGTFDTFSIAHSINFTIVNQMGEPDHILYDIATVNWLDGTTYLYTLTYIEGMPMQTVTMPVLAGGFNASGIATIQKVTQGGIEYLTAFGTLPNITITDSLIYDPSYTDLFFSVTIEL